MNRRIYFVLIFSFLFICRFSHAQNWAGILDPSRAIDWSRSGVVGGIPARTTHCADLGSPGQPASFVQNVTATQINNALASCPAGQTVFLNAGTYNLSSGVTFGAHSNITLRGAGADKTLLVFTNTGSCGLLANVCIWSGDFSDRDHVEHSASWTGGYAKGTTVVTLSNTTGLAVGNFILLDQLDDSADGYPAAGDIFVCSTATCTGQGGGNNTRPSRGQLQMSQVTAISGNNVTISPGLTMPNWRASQSPGAWWPNSVVHDDGVENLTVDGTSSSQCGTCANIVLFNARNSWIRGIRSIEPNNSGGQPLAAHIWLNETMSSTVRDSYFYGSNNSSQSYGVEFFVTSFDLVENNIFQHVTAPTVEQGPGTGNVIGYNFAIDDNFTAAGTTPHWMDPMHTWHEVGQAMELYEGNSGLGFQADNIHGTHQFGTYFRNYYYGDIWNNPTKTDNTEVIHLWRYSRFFNIIGNVLGRTAYYTAYEGGSTAIFSVSGDPDPASPSGTPSDPRTKATLMRWGNYDTVTGASRFVASEVPSGIANFSNPVPATNALPASFYYSSKPGWFGSVAWPPIGPDVTGGNQAGLAGHANKLPAENCWYNVMKAVVGSSGLLTFNADTCYAASTPVSSPAAPTGLSVVVK